MNIISEFIRTHALQIKKSLEKILNQDDWESENFEISKKYTDLKKNFNNLPSDSTEKSITMFGLLSPYFTSGLFLYRRNNNSNDWHLGSAFRYSQFHSIENVLNQISLKLPDIENGELKKTSPYTLLNPFGFGEWSDGTESTAFVYKFCDSNIGLFFLDLPEPWLRVHIETIHKLITSKYGT
jgi:hypothetical protein